MLLNSPLLRILKAATDDDFEYSFTDIEIIEEAVDIGLGPILFHLLEKKNQNKSIIENTKLISANLTSKIIISNYIETLNEIFNRCSPNLVENITLLKGISIALQFYPKPYMRTMADIDLLIDKKHEKELEEVCRQMGFQQKSELPKKYYDSLHHSMPFYHPTRKIWIEIHSALFPPHYLISNDYVFSLENIFKNKTHIILGEHNPGRLSSELQLIYTCSHWVQEHNWMKSLIRIQDILYIIRNDGKNFNWDTLENWCGNTISSSQLYLILSILDKYKLAHIPKSFLLSIFKKQRNLNKLNVLILHKIIIKYSFNNQLFGGIISSSLISTIWRSLILSKHSAYVNLLFILPLNIIFPPRTKNKYSPAFQISRIYNLFKKVFNTF